MLQHRQRSHRDRIAEDGHIGQGEQHLQPQRGRPGPRFAGRPDLRLLAAPEQEYRVRELLAGAGPRAWPDGLRHALNTRGFAAQVRGALARRF